MRKGFSLPLLLIIILFVAAPFLFFFFKTSHGNDVKGSSSINSQNGFYIVLNSTQGNWDLYQVGCTSIDECAETLDSGRRINMVSGGQTTGHRVSFSDTSAYSGFSFVKFYVKPSWGSATRTFKLTVGNDSLVVSKSFESESALIVPVSALSKSTFMAGSFSD